ncbi:MAG: hypothetical protein R3C19_11505 [Planctomycetaceae bacterium]
MTDDNWTILEPDIESILSANPEPLESLAAGDVPAVVIRSAFAADSCRELVGRLVDRGLLYDPAQPVPDQFVRAAIPEGYFREGRSQAAAAAWDAGAATDRRRIDIGTSLGYRGSDPEEFFAHARDTHALFADLFADGDNPIRTLYESLQRLSPEKQVTTAREPDGREYGPAIIRAHYGGYTYAPHFDSVRLREKREGYAVHDFEHQFAGVLVLQNTQDGDRSAQCVLHRCLWQPDVDPYLQAGTFHEYASRTGIANVRVVLEPGDLYFFNTRCIHEVPGVAGRLPRIVVATFIGYSSDRNDIFVWS